MTAAERPAWRVERAIAGLYFLSGACSLMDQVVWVRLLKLTLGNTVYATTVVVSVFLGGLALGALILSRFADRIERRLEAYAALETVVTVAALAVPWLLARADALYAWFFRTQSPSPPLLLLGQVAVSAAILLVPTVAMGATLPLLARAVAVFEDDSGRRVGRLYAINTLGAATGCFAAGFVMIRTLGVMGTLWAAAAMNLLVVAGALALRSRARSVAPSRATARTSAPPASSTARGGFLVLALAFFASGFASIGYEIAWVRSAVFILGGDTYVFSAILTVYLLGNVAGTAIGTRVVRRVERPAAAFAVTLGLLGASGLLYLPGLLVWAGGPATALEALVKRVGEQAPIAAATLLPLGTALALFLVPALLMGIGFPLALQAWADRVHLVGRATGAAYAANTVGAVLGGIVTGFALIPGLGLARTIAVLAAGLLLIAALLHARASAGRAIRRWGVSGAAAAIAAAGLLLAGDPLATLVARSPWITPDLETVSIREGVTTTVSVHREPERGTLHMYSSGQSIAGDTFALRGDQKALGHFGGLLHPDARDVLSVGFGSGETTRCMAAHAPQRIDCVEIAPEVVESALEYFPHLNLGPRLAESVNLIYMDAKNYLHLTDRQYDVIVNDSIHPREFAENASLYGKEYFASARARLRPGGLFVSWLPTYHMTAGAFDSILGTLMDVFPHVSLWYLIQNPAPLVVLVASDEPQRFPVAHIETALENPAIRDSLALIGIYDAMDLLNCYMGDETDLRDVIGDYRTNSDDTPYVEFDTAPFDPAPEMYRRYVMDSRSTTIAAHLDLAGLAEPAASAWLARFQARHSAGNHLVRGYSSANELEHLRLFTEGLVLSPGDRALLRAIREVETTLSQKGQRVLAAEGPDRAMSLADLILAIHPQSSAAWLIRSSVLESRGDHVRAVEAARTALAADPESAEARERLARLGAAGSPAP
jgi:spermidine synthase